MQAVLRKIRFSSIALLLASAVCFSITYAATPPIATPPMAGKPANPPVSPNAVNKPTVVSMAVKLVGIEANATVGTTAHLKASVAGADQLPLSNTGVTFSHNGRDLGAALTGTDGIAKWDFDVIEELPVGPNVINLRLTNQPAIQANLTLTVAKAETRIGSPHLDYSPIASGGYLAMVHGDLARGNGAGHDSPFSAVEVPRNRKVVIKFDNQTFIGTTGNGKYGASIDHDFQVKPADFGKKIEVSITFDGDDHYFKSSYTFPTVTLPKPPPPEVPAPDFSYHVTGPVQYGSIQVAPGQSVDIDVVLRGYTDSVSGQGMLKMPVQFELQAKPVSGPGGQAGTAFVVGRGTAVAYTGDPAIGKGKIHFTYPITSAFPAAIYDLVAYLTWNGSGWPPSFKAQQVSTGDKLLILAQPTTMQVKAPTSASTGDTIAVDVYTTRASDGKPVTFPVRVSHTGGQMWQENPDVSGHTVIKIPMNTVGLGRQGFSVENEIYSGGLAGYAKTTFSVNVTAMPLQMAPQSPFNK